MFTYIKDKNWAFFCIFVFAFLIIDTLCIQTSFSHVVFATVVALLANTFLFASAAGAPFEYFLGFISGLAKTQE